MGGDGDLSAAEERLVSRFSGRDSGLIGHFAGRPASDLWVWDRPTLALLGRPFASAPTSIELLLGAVPVEERGMVADAFQAALAGPVSFTTSCRVTTASDQLRSVMIVADSGDLEPAGPTVATTVPVDQLEAGSGPWLVGHLIDLTELRLGAAREAMDHAVAEAFEHRAVIEQAKGMLMLAGRIDADAAFALLAQRSQQVNTKLAALAAELVADHRTGRLAEELVRSREDDGDGL